MWGSQLKAASETLMLICSNEHAIECKIIHETTSHFIIDLSHPYTYMYINGTYIVMSSIV